MKRFILVDGNSLMYRAYYGMQRVMTNSKGLPTNAIYAFARMMNHLCDSEYDAILVAFDAGKVTFRHEIMQDYKAGRAPMPNEMRAQIAYIKEFLDLKRIKRYEISLYEADDIIGSMANKAKKEGFHVDIYSSDRDLLQLIDDDICVHMTKKGMTELEDFDKTHFKEVYDLDVSQFVDLKALMGDKSDNLIGVPGIGEKKAIKYLKEYNSLANLLENVANIKGKDQERFLEYKEVALKCKEMATILKEAPIELEVSDCLKKEENIELLHKFYQDLEFHSFLKETKKKDVAVSYEIVNSLDRLKEVLIPKSYIVIENSDSNYHKAYIIALGIVNEKGNFIIEPNLFKSSILKEYLENDNDKIVYDYKRMFVSLKHFDISVKGIAFDLYLAAYLLNSKVTKNEFKVVCDYFLPTEIKYDEEVYGKGAKRKVPAKEVIYPNIILKALGLKEAYPLAYNKLLETEQLELLTNVEIPLSYTLGKMEYNGLKVDLEELNNQDLKLSANIKELEEKIYAYANQEFNISSPKQLAEVLFVNMALPYPKSSKKGYSTDISILEAIKEVHPIIPLIIDYRQNTKLYSTYIKGLKEQIFNDGKVHTIFCQAITETGRLSSVEPNLQNIPIRTPLGHLIRKIFIPDHSDEIMFSADYSQIELRVLAALANVKHFINAFNNNEDIHASTAREIFNHEDITPLERRKAKAVNFGIVYGISAYGLAQDIDVSSYEAKEFIDRYNEINPEINLYMAKVLAFCKENGYVKTIFNRRRYIPEINSSNFMEREYAKRMAMNAPIQGSAADIIKIAMINIDKALEEGRFKSKMLVQVHDELVFDVYEDELESLKELVISKMNNAVKLIVPLEVGTGTGKNWYELK